jgi:hypothetical protein
VVDAKKSQWKLVCGIGRDAAAVEHPTRLSYGGGGTRSSGKLSVS